MTRRVTPTALVVGADNKVALRQLVTVGHVRFELGGR